MQELPEEEYGCTKCGAEWLCGLQLNFRLQWLAVPLLFENTVHYKLSLIFPLSLSFTL